MPDRAGKILKWACLPLAALLVVQLAHIVPRANVLKNVVIPGLPTLAAEKTNSASSGAQATNAVKAVASASTNKPLKLAATTNALAANSATNAPGTNSPDERMATNVIAAAVSTNASNAAPSLSGGATNSPVVTNSLAAASTNSPNTRSNAPGTNAANLAKGNRRSGPPRMPMGMGPNAGTPLAELPPETKARINRIYDSEILAQAMHPLPAGLIGIAGDVAFLRSASGQTGLVKEGESVGELKLLRIGINRVLVEANGQKREFTIFDGYGSTSLLSEEGKK